MRSVTQAFLDAVRGGGELALHVELQPITGPSIDITDYVIDGGVTLDRTSDRRGTGSLTISAVNPLTGEPLPVNSAPYGAAPYGSEATLYRGFHFPDGTAELVLLGIYRLNSAPRTLDENSVQVDLVDRSAQLADEQLLTPTSYAKTQQIVDVIELLIQDVYPTATVHLPSDTTTLGKKTVVEQDRWQAITDFAAAIGCEVFVDADGDWWVQAPPDPSAGSPVWTVNAGADGVLIDGTVTATRQSVYNGVVVTGEPADKHAPAYALVVDDDPDSPTRWDGPFGKVPDFLTSEKIRTDAQAEAAGEARLLDLLGQARSVELTAVPNPALEPGDTITVVYPDGTEEQHLVDSVTIPLTPEGTQEIQTRSTAL